MTLSYSARAYLSRLMNGERRQRDEPDDVRIPGVVWEIDGETFHESAARASLADIIPPSIQFFLVVCDARNVVVIAWHYRAKYWARTLSAMESIFLLSCASNPH